MGRSANGSETTFDDVRTRMSHSVSVPSSVQLNWSPRDAQAKAIGALMAPKKSPSQLDLSALVDLTPDPAFVAARNTLGAGVPLAESEIAFGRTIDEFIDPVATTRPATATTNAPTSTPAAFAVGGTTTTNGTAAVSIAMTPLGAVGVAVPAVAAQGTHDRPITIDLKRGGTLVIPAPVPTPAPGTGQGHVHNRAITLTAAQADVAAANADVAAHNAAAAAGAGAGAHGADAKRSSATASPVAREVKDGKIVFTETEKTLMAMSNGTAAQAVAELKSTMAGLTAEQAKQQLAICGLNKLLDDGGILWYVYLWRAFLHPFNVLLLALAIVNLVVAQAYTAAGILCGMVIMAVGMRFWQEYKSALSAESLKQRVTHDVRVRRPKADSPDGYELVHVPYDHIVPGEIVELAAGDLVPGDIRIIESHNLLVNQSILTGESVPIERTTVPHAGPADTDQLQRTNLSFMGATVETGSGVVVVLLTGPRTYFGQNAKLLTAERGETAFAVGVRRVSYTLMGFMAVMVPIVLIVSGFVQGSWYNAGLFTVSVAVGLTPEMLPMIVNSNLSLGAAKMSRHKCVVKRLEAIQNIGAMDVLCTDKTGTLTMDKVQVHSSLDFFGKPNAIPLAQSYIIAFHQKGFRNVLDNAIVSAIEGKPLEDHATGKPIAAEEIASAKEAKRQQNIKDGLELSGDLKEERLSPEQEAQERESAEMFKSARALTTGIGQTTSMRVAELPFDFFRRRMSIVATTNGGRDAGVPAGVVARMYTKGAMDEMIPICSHWADCRSGVPVAQPMRPEDRAAVVKLLENLNREGLRVLAVAYKDFDNLSVAEKVDNKAEVNLTLCGLLTFLDPPKPDTHEVLRRMAALNVKVKVLTGDNILVAKKVCSVIGIDVTHTLTGDQMRHLDIDDESEEVYQLFMRTCVFARLSPTQKARVIRVLKLHGRVVGMLGDGVNDALALKEADCGVSVDTGADLAKDAADMILTEKNLDVLHHGIVTGRRVHGNTIKYIKMTASSNFGNVFSLIIASAWLPFLPMQPVQLLLGNIIYDLSQLAIPWDQMDEEYLREPKVWSAGGLIRFMAWMGPTSSIFDIITFAFGLYVYGYDTAEDADPMPLGHEDDTARFNSLWFLEGLITQTLIVHMIRTKKIPFIQSRAHGIVCCTTVFCVGIAILLNMVPAISHGLDMIPVPGSYFGFLAVNMVVYCIVVQCVKLTFLKVYNGDWL